MQKKNKKEDNILKALKKCFNFALQEQIFEEIIYYDGMGTDTWASVKSKDNKKKTDT